MLRLPFVLLFVALTFVSWGLYGPVLHIGQNDMGHSLLRPYMCVGMAYFLIAVLVPSLLLRRDGEKGHWSASGAIWSFLAGAAGAVGALGIIVAFQARGKPVYVMPLVFGCAPVVNTFVTMWMTKTTKQAKTIFYLGVLLVAVGAAGVLFYKPKPSESPPAPDTAAASTTQPADPEPELLARELFTIIGAIAVTALCWGCYGPVLHKGQVRMDGSRMRPFLCVGLAYFAIAVIVPAAVLLSWTEPGHWTFVGSLWALGAGVFGALGALGIIMAFNFGGKPIYVMPLVFGGAPVINTLTSILKATVETGSPGQIPWLFYASLTLVVIGAVIVLVFSPKAPAKAHVTPTIPKAKKEPQVATTLRTEPAPKPIETPSTLSESEPADPADEKVPPTPPARDADQPPPADPPPKQD